MKITRNQLRNLLLETVIESQKPIRKKVNMIIPDGLKHIVSLFDEVDKDLYVVGGAVRDTLLGKVPKDYDVATDAEPEEVMKILESDSSIKQDLTGKSFGVVRANMKNGEEYEIATFRKDFGKGRRPDYVEFTTIEQDVKRRDLTINALFYDLERSEVVDYVGGIKDLEDGVIRAVGNPHDRFNEDKLRVLRAVRFAFRFDSKIDDVTRDAIIDNNDLSSLPGDRITDEFKKGIKGSLNPQNFIRKLNELGLLSQVLPGSKLNINTNSQSNNITVQVALVLKDQDVNYIKPMLKNMRYTSSDINTVVFLLSFYDITPELAPILKKLFKRFHIDDKTIKEYAQARNMADNLVSGFLQFVNSPPAASARDLMSQGVSGQDIGIAINKAEQEAYLRNINENLLYKAISIMVFNKNY